MFQTQVQNNIIVIDMIFHIILNQNDQIYDYLMQDLMTQFNKNEAFDSWKVINILDKEHDLYPFVIAHFRWVVVTLKSVDCGRMLRVEIAIYYLIAE